MTVTAEKYDFGEFIEGGLFEILKHFSKHLKTEENQKWPVRGPSRCILTSNQHFGKHENIGS
jgi:hypothetical protein